MNRNTETPDIERAMELVAFPIIAVLFGTCIGGFFKRWLDGAMFGFIMFLPGSLAVSILIQMFRR